MLYYGAVIGGAIVVHQRFFRTAFGEDVADLFRRNSEAYVLMVLVPAYWDRFGLRIGFPSGIGLRHVRVRSGRAQQIGWIVSAAVLGILLQIGAITDGVGIPQSVVTLSEGFLAAAIVAVYLGWTRRLFIESGDGRGTEDGGPQPFYYLVILVVTVIAHRGWPAGAGLADVATANVEAVGAALVLPAFFDVIYERGFSRLMLWSAFMVVVPVLSQPGVFDEGAIGSLTGWLVRATEAFLAGLVIAWYYYVVRSTKPTALRLP